MARIHDNVVVKRVLPPFILRKTLDAKVRSRRPIMLILLWAVWSLFWLNRLFFIPAKHTPYCIGQSASAFTQVLNYFPLDGHKMFKIFFLKSRVSEIMVVENNNKPGKKICICFQFRRKTMNKKLLCAVLLMLVAVAIVCHAQPSDFRQRYGKKRSFQVDFPSVTGKRWKYAIPVKR